MPLCSHHRSDLQDFMGDTQKSSSSKDIHFSCPTCGAGPSSSRSEEEEPEDQQPPAYVAASSYRAPGEFWYLGIQIPDPNLPRVSMNRLKYPPYDPKVDWEKIEATIEQKPAQYTSYDVADPLRGKLCSFESRVDGIFAYCFGKLAASS